MLSITIANAFYNKIDAKRTLHEMKLLRHMDHENVVAIRDIIPPPQREVFNDVYIAYELMDTDLHQISRSNQVLSEEHCQVVKFLLSGDAIDKDLIDVKARNEVGLTPLDILLLVNNEAGDAEMVEILMRSRATRAAYNGGYGRSPRLEYFKYKKERESPSDVRNALLVVAALITIATYQAMLQPPGGFWQDNSGSSSSSTGATSRGIESHKASQPVLGTKSLPSYILFIISNSAGFFASARTITILTLGFPMQMELQVALFALIGMYATVMSTLTPNTFFNYFFGGLAIYLPVIIGLVSRWVREGMPRG